MKVFDKTISTIVDENYVYARALSCLGIEFYLDPNKKLGEICAEKGLNRQQVIKSFYTFDQVSRLSFTQLEKYPLELLMQYLKHAHHIFIKEKLPYIAKLIQAFEGYNDLKLIFPDFIEEFIKHIYEEEDQLFGKVNALINIDRNKVVNPAALWEKYAGSSICRTHLQHEEEDELKGLRELINQEPADGVHWKVVISELRAFDREMLYHAEIENKIFFPKAIRLEARVKENMTWLILQN